jgi:predicted DNA-binding protein (UPF0251 family)
MVWRQRRRCGRRGRFPKPIKIEKTPTTSRFSPTPQSNPVPIYIEPVEIEVLRLVDLEELSQEETGERIGVSRGTVWRLLQSARKKTIQALTEGRPLLIATKESYQEKHES